MTLWLCLSIHIPSPSSRWSSTLFFFQSVKKYYSALLISSLIKYIGYLSVSRFVSIDYHLFLQPNRLVQIIVSTFFSVSLIFCFRYSLNLLHTPVVCVVKRSSLYWIANFISLFASSIRSSGMFQLCQYAVQMIGRTRKRGDRTGYPVCSNGSVIARQRAHQRSFTFSDSNTKSTEVNVLLRF